VLTNAEKEHDFEPGMVRVKRSWFDDRDDIASPDDIDGVRWDWISGGVQAVQPRESLFGYVLCDVVDGVGHSCRHGGGHPDGGGHSIKVLITKKGSDPEVYERLRNEASRRRAQKVG
jgi:hypothetical protein